MAARPVFQWHAQHEDLYVGQQNAARVLLLATGDTRVLSRLLPAAHASSTFRSRSPRTCGGSTTRHAIRSRDRAGARARADSTRYVRGGGRVLVAGTTPPALPDRPRRRPTDARRATGASTTGRGFRRCGTRTCSSSTATTSSSRRSERPVLTLIPTAMFGPPEKVWARQGGNDESPGLVVRRPRQGPRRVRAVGRRRALLPPQLAGPRGSAGRSRRPSPAEGPADPDERASARRDDADGSAGAQPDARAPRERHRPPRHGVLPAGRDARHPHRAAAPGAVARGQSRSAATCRSPRTAASSSFTLPHPRGRIE